MKLTANRPKKVGSLGSKTDGLPRRGKLSGLLEPLKFRFYSRFSLRGVHYHALGGDFKGAAAPCVAMLLDCSSQLHVSRPLATNESHCQRGNVTVARSLRRQNGQPKSSLDAPAEMIPGNRGKETWQTGKLDPRICGKATDAHV